MEWPSIMIIHDYHSSATAANDGTTDTRHKMTQVKLIRSGAGAMEIGNPQRLYFGGG